MIKLQINSAIYCQGATSTQLVEGKNRPLDAPEVILMSKSPTLQQK